MIDAEKIKTLRHQQAWTQEQLAGISGVAYWTIQRIEATGKAAMESARALANAFGIDVSELLRPVPKTPEEPSPKPKGDDVPRVLVRINSGANLFAIVAGAHASSVENDELKSEAEVEIVGSFLQEISDWGEMWNELEQGERVRQTFEFTQKLKDLNEAGFVVFATREKRTVRVADQIFPDWNVAIIRVIHSTNPAIVCIAPEDGISNLSTSVAQY